MNNTLMVRHTEDSRKKISEGLKRAYSLGKRKNLTPMAGHTHSEETKRRMRDAAIKRIIDKPHTIPDNTGRLKSDAGYAAIHNWVNKYFEPKEKCEMCGATQYLDWANKDGNYSRDRNDWMVLCRSDHMKYDRANNIWKPARLR